jgi:hypothetical protein
MKKCLLEEAYCTYKETTNTCNISVEIFEKENMPAGSSCRIEDVITLILKKYFRMKCTGLSLPTIKITGLTLK